MFWEDNVATILRDMRKIAEHAAKYSDATEELATGLGEMHSHQYHQEDIVRAIKGLADSDFLTYYKESALSIRH